jgi:PhnB protein
VADVPLADRLDRTVDAIVRRTDATAALRDAELAPLAKIAADLRDLPGPEFKARLRAQLRKDTTMPSPIVLTRPRAGFSAVTPYLRVRDGGFVDFLTRVFAAVETHSAPGSGGGTHRELRIGDSMIIVHEGGAGSMESSRPAEFHVYVEDADAVFQQAMEAGAASFGDPAERPYGERAGFVKDPFGNHWFIATHRGGSYLPKELRTVTPFLHVEKAGDYIAFLERAFGAVEEGRHETPDGRVMYARLRIGDAAIELGESQGTIESMAGDFYLVVDDPDSLSKQALAAGATPLSPPAVQRPAAGVVALTDPMGVRWFIGPAA